MEIHSLVRKRTWSLFSIFHWNEWSEKTVPWKATLYVKMSWAEMLTLTPERRWVKELDFSFMMFWWLVRQRSSVPFKRYLVEANITVDSSVMIAKI